MVEPGAELAEKVTLALMELQNRKENEAGTLGDGSGLREMIVCFLSECKPSKENLTSIPEKLRHISKALALLAELCENDRVRIHGSLVEYLDTNIKDIQDIILTVPLPQRLDIWDSFMIILVRNGLGSSKHIDQICRSIQPAFSEKDPNIISRTLVSWARMIRQFDLSAADDDRRVCLLVTPLMFAKERFQCQDAVCDTWIALCRATGKRITYYFEPTVLSLLRYCAGGTMVFVTPDRIGKHLKKAISVNSTRLFCPEIEELMRSPIWSPEKHMKYLQSTFNNPLRTTRLLPLIARVLGLNSSEEKLSSHDPLEARECMWVASVFFMQLIRLLSANAIKDEHMEMLEKCVVEIGIKMCKVLEGKQLIDSLSNYCIQMRAWIVESKLPFHVVAGALRDFLTRVDIKKLSTGCGDNWPSFDVFTSLFERFHTPAESCHSLISSLLERFVELTVESKSDHVLIRLKEVADITVELAGTKRKINPRHLFPVALRLMESLRRHIELHEDINDGGMSAPKFETLSRIAELPMSITRNFESPMDVLIPHEELCSAWKSLFVAAHTEIKGEVACDYATTFKLFCELCTEYSKQLPETTLSCELFLSIVQSVDFAAIAACSSRTDSVAFDSLGQLSLAKETFGVLVEAFVEQSTQESKSSLGSFGAEFLSVSLSTLLKSAATVVSGSAQPSLVRSLFQAIVPSVTKLVHLQQERGILIKKPASSFSELIISFLDNSHRNICGPFDDELLTSCSALLVATLGHSDFKIRKAAQNFWKETFSQATQLSYPEELREVIRNCVSKGTITAPDVDDCMMADSLPSAITEKMNEQEKHKSSVPSSPFARPKSSSANRRTPMSARGSAQKRSLRMALGPEEDSVDYAVIPPANKKIHLTEHQKEKYMEQRVANRLFVDEDSRQEPMWKTVPDIFESDSRSTTVTNKGMPKSAKAQVQSNGSEDAARDKADTDKEIRIETEQVDMRTPDKTEKIRDHNLQSPGKKSPSRSLTGTRDLSKSTTTATDFSSLADNEQVVERQSENTKPKTTVVTPRSASGKRRSAVKLNFDDLPGSNQNSTNADDVNKPPQAEVVIISSNESDNSQQSGENGNVGRSSRRSQSKATPVRYVGTGSETRRRLGGVQSGLNRTAPESVLATTPKSAKRGLPRKSLALNVNVDEDKENMKQKHGDGEAKADKPVDDECMVIEDESPPPETEKQETHKKQSKDDDVMIIEESPEDEVFIGNDKSPEKAPDYRSPEKVNQAPTLATPKMMRRVFEQTTPGILRKIGSPFSAEKKSRRVHFGSSSSTEESTKENSLEKEIPVSTTAVQQVNVTPEKTPPSSAHKMAVTPPSGLRRGSASSTASTPNNETLGDSDDVLFPDLTSCKDPIFAIINKLTLMKTGGAGSSGSMLLRKQLASKGVHTVGDLARMNPASIHSLPLRRPKVDTAKQALSEYLAKKNSATSPGRPEPVGASTSQGSEKGNTAPLDSLVSLPLDLGAKKANGFPVKQAGPTSAQDDDFSVVSTLVHEVLLPGEGATQALSKSFVEGLLNPHVKKERPDTQPHDNEREPSIEQNTSSSAPALTTNTTVTVAPTPMEVDSTGNGQDDKEQEDHADLEATQPVEASQTTVAVSKHSQNAPLSAGELLAGVLKQSASQEEYATDSKMLDDFFTASSLLKERIAALEGHSFNQEDMLRVFKELTDIGMRGHEALAKGVGVGERKE